MWTPFIIIVGLALAIVSTSCGSIVQSSDTRPTSTSPAAITRLHLPQPWLGESAAFYLIQQLEVRKAPNSSDGEFIFRALPDDYSFYAHEVDKKVPKPRYSATVYAVNFSGGLRVRNATQQEWESGPRIPTKPRYVFPKGNDDYSKEIEYRQKRYSKAGKYWGTSGLSPTGRWLAVFSYNGEDPPPNFSHFITGGAPLYGDVFWQIYDTGTGERVFEREAKNVKSPTQLDDPVSGWRTVTFYFLKTTRRKIL